MAAVSSSPAFSQPKVVEKVFGLPIVSDSYSYGKIVLLNLYLLCDKCSLLKVPLFPTVDNASIPLP